MSKKKKRAKNKVKKKLLRVVEKKKMKKTQILYVPSRPIIIRHPETRGILKKVDSIKEAGNILNMDYRTLRRLFKKHSLQELGVPKEWNNKYNISYAIWEKCENIEEIEQEKEKESNVVEDSTIIVRKEVKKGYYCMFENIKEKEVDEEIKLETYGKVGVYMFENTITNCRFIGEVRKPGKKGGNFYDAYRKAMYNNDGRLKLLKNDREKYGINSLNFYILDFTSEKDVTKVKHKYITMINPEYNKKQNSKKEEIKPKNLKEFYQDYPFIRPNVKSIDRIGPHSEKIISIIFGTLLGDSYGERRKYSVKGGIRQGGTRITFQQEDSNREYLMKFWKDVAEMGYCRNQEPNMLTRIGKNGKIRWYYKVHTWTFTSLNWIQELFYDEKNRKFVPKNIGRFLTPRALAHWFMDDGSRSSGGVKFSTNSFTYEDVEFLGTVLKEKYNLDCTVQSAGVKNQYNLYILKNSMQDFNNIVRPYMVKSMERKLHL